MVQNKHVIRLSFIGLFITIVANIVLYRYFMIEEVVIKQISEQNARISDLYKSKIWDYYPEIISSLKAPDFQPFKNRNFINFAKESVDFFNETKENISLYNKYGSKLIENKTSDFSNNKSNYSHSVYNKLMFYTDKYFLSSYFSANPLLESLHGKTRHILSSKATFIAKDNSQYEKSFVTSYIPIIASKNGDFSVEGVIKITTDITEQWDDIESLEQRIFIFFLIVFALFFLVVLLNTSYAQRIINKQFEVNRQLEEAKLKAESDNSAKTEFLANISHELRTPLNAIIGFSEILLSESYGKIENPEHKSYIGDINNSGKHLLSVINDILDFSKASVDKLQIDKVELNLNKLIASSMRFVKPRADAANILLIEDLPKEHVVIKADPKRLKQALLNLLSNSVKFTPSDGSITVSIRRNSFKKLVHIIVTDTGIGMREQDIPKALSSFGQVDNKLSRKYEGTGLGLPLTKKLVELMEGTFDIKSTLGKGTKVTLTFKYHNSIKF